MKRNNIGSLLLICSLVLVIMAIPAASTGCTAANKPGAISARLAATMVPPVDLDLYIYFDQQVPTIVPKVLTGAPADLPVQSVAIWGIVNNETQYTISGALIFKEAADASMVFGLVSKLPGFYTKLNNRSIYFLQGSGGPAESLKNAIDNNNFKAYNDKTALTEVNHLPLTSTARPNLIGIIKPNKAALDMAKKYLDKYTANTIESIVSSAKPKTLVLGVYSPKPLEVADMAQRIRNNTVWDLDLGAVVCMDSEYPGFMFNSIANNILKSQNLPEVQVGKLNAYKESLDLGNGKTIPIYLNLSGNHVYAAASGQDSYAQTLLTSINR